MTEAKKILLAIMVSAHFIGCATKQPDSPSDISNEAPETFLPRPRFTNPIPRPLNRVLLQWLEIEKADGYEIQMSETESFNTITKMWIVKGVNLEIPIPREGTIRLRIRAFNSSATSGWSAVLEIKESL